MTATLTAPRKRTAPLRPGDTLAYRSEGGSDVRTGIVWSLAPNASAWVHCDSTPGADPELIKLPAPRDADGMPYATAAHDWRGMLAAVRVLDATRALPVLRLDEIPGEYAPRRVWHALTACEWQHDGADRTSISGSAWSRDRFRSELINGNRTACASEYSRNRDRAYRLGDTLCPACLTAIGPVLTPGRAS